MSDEPIGVHPVANLFPMLSDDELADLAADIEAHGLNHPITLDRDGRIVDGRNRHAACLLANVDPEFVVLDHGVDPVAFVLSENVHRRHISKGQLAMAMARARLLSNLPMSAVAASVDISKARVVQANVVLEFAPDLAELVISGATFLNDAYAEARKRKVVQETQAESDARALAQTNARTARLRAEAPDLADLVAEWRISLDDAIAVLDERERLERERKQRATLGFAKATSYLHALLQPNPEQVSRDWSPAENTLAGVAGCEDLWTSAGLAELAAWLGRVAEAWEDTRR